MVNMRHDAPKGASGTKFKIRLRSKDMPVIDYYRLLGVARSATVLEIRKAYRSLVLRYHPDRNPGNQEAEDRFKAISEAYRVLSHDTSRFKYDILTAGQDVPRVPRPAASPAPPKPHAQAKPQPQPAPKTAPKAAPKHEPDSQPTPRTKDKGLRTYLDYQNELNELDPWDGVLGITFGIAATLVAHALLRPSDRRPGFLALFIWLLVPFLLGPTGYFMGQRLARFFEGMWDIQDSNSWILESFTKTLPLLFPLMLCSAALVSSQFFQAGIFTWRILPAAVAGGLCSLAGSGIGRAFVIVAESKRGKIFGAFLGALIGSVGGMLVGLCLALLSSGRSFDIMYFEGFFSAGLGGAIGGALGSFVGSFREFRPVDSDEGF